MSIFRIAAAGVAALFLCGSVWAAPGWTVTGLTVSPPDAPKVVAAMDALFNSEVGKKAPGRIVLRANVADGDNPETHAVVALARSAEEREKYQAELYASQAWATFLAQMSSLSSAPGTTARGVIAWNTGDRSDADVVWVNHYLRVREPGALVSAINTYANSASGKARASQVHLSAILAGGDGASHIISVGYASETEMEAEISAQQQDPAYRAMVDTFNAVADYLGATLQRDLKAWGKASVQDVTNTGN